MGEGEAFKPSGTKGGLCGCLAAIAFALPVSAMLVFAWGWGASHCEPAPRCVREGELRVAAAAAVMLALAALLGFAVRALVDWWGRRRADPAAAGWPPVWAILVAAPLIYVAARMAWEMELFGLFLPY